MKFSISRLHIANEHGQSALTTILLVSAALPFVALAVWAGATASDQALKNLSSTTLGVALAIAVFAVNFSFLAFQLAPYRSQLRGASQRHLGAALVMVLLALVPLIGLHWCTIAVGRLGVIVIPLLGYGALLLTALGIREASPARILERGAADSELRRFGRAFARAVRAQTRDLKRLDPDLDTARDERVPPPMHEITHKVPPPPVPRDPVAVCTALAEAAIERDDAPVFVPAVERLLALTETLAETTFPTKDDVEGWEVSSAARLHAEDALRRVARALTVAHGRESLADRYIEALARYVRETALREQATERWTGDVVWSAVAVCRSQLERQTAGAGIVGLLLALRQVVERTSRGELPDQQEWTVASYSSVVQQIGEAAVTAKDSDIVYRCLETLSWMGCAAVRYGKIEPGRRAASGLVQLGRLARKADLECHWDRCALTPYQHADERLSWMATWIPKAEKPTDWTGMLGRAFSRLRGYECSLSFDPTSDPLTVKLTEDPATPHKESYFASGGQRTLDYSDPAMLKESNLH